MVSECASTTWKDLVTFFLLNYFAYAMTVRTFPGEKWFTAALWTMAALLVPFSGVRRAAKSIAAGKFRSETDLRHAARAAALCCLVRTSDWVPPTDVDLAGFKPTRPSRNMSGGRTAIRVVSNCTTPRVSPKTHRIHGEIVEPLPPGYEFRILPADIDVSPHSSITLSNSQAIFKCMASIAQLIYACITLYSARGSQLAQYGYAAFGLTVVPYAIMSLVNMIANIVTPEYPCLYMVRSEIMDEAQNRGGCFDGTIGVIQSHRAESEIAFRCQSAALEKVDGESVVFAELAVGGETDHSIAVSDIGRHSKLAGESGRFHYFHILSWWVTILAFVSPYAIIGGVTKFKGGSSSSVQRGFILAWLVWGQCSGVLLERALDRLCRWLSDRSVAQNRIVLLIWILVVYGVPAVGGFVIVGKMILEFGSCVTPN